MQLTGLYVYPVKSCAGIAVDAWPLDARGLVYDRSYMVVDARTGGFLTQRHEPRLALVLPQLSGATLTLAAGDESVAVPLAPVSGPQTTVTVWEHTGPATDCGDAAAALLSDHLGRRVRLVAVAPSHSRSADAAYAGPDAAVGFSDSFPLLIIGQASLAALNDRLPEPLPMNRFRPNLVVGGAAPFAEDDWHQILVGGIRIDVVKPCARCATTTVDQASGRRAGKEPLRTLGAFRKGERGVLFGQNAVHRTLGTLRLGDEVAVVAARGAPAAPMV